MHPTQPHHLRHLTLSLLMALTLSTTTYAADTPAPEPAPNTTAPSGVGADNLLISAVAWKQTAAEYRALYYQGYNMARLQLEKALREHKDGDKPLAVVTDLDDTVLLPLAYWGYLINHKQDFFDDAAWDKWIPKNQMVVAPGAAEFLKFAADNKVEVFYVSSRDQGEKTFEYALAQIKAAGLPFADEAHVTILRDTSNKETRQKEIAEKFEVALFLGDNLNDFQRKYYTKDVDERIKLMEEDKNQYGSKYIVFPNPTDGHWVRAIFGESEPPASDANRETFQKAATRNSWDGN
ncbi:5'-nucleotidase, lipoprotein e(P4) family [Thiofilum flexile]|uniref:5'-nucleotidase, lipoprotein e(P4) family n=1 Tax=Thiofilum flexile TaxID=125627 RepID=UPI000377372A|nr:5'-nucleotidase, lipoprotein e(P4) family [Thiofilum flexile]